MKILFLYLVGQFLLSCNIKSKPTNYQIDSVFVSARPLNSFLLLDSIYIKSDNHSNSIIGFRNFFDNKFLDVSQQISFPFKYNYYKIYFTEAVLIKVVRINNHEIYFYPSKNDFSFEVKNSILKKFFIDVIDEKLIVTKIKIQNPSRIKLKSMGFNI